MTTGRAIPAPPALILPVAQMKANIMLCILNKIDSAQRYNDDGEVLEVTAPVVVNPAYVRCFYGRKFGKSGTRLTFSDGKGFAVAETFEAVTALFAPGETLTGEALPVVEYVPPSRSTFTPEEAERIAAEESEALEAEAEQD